MNLRINILFQIAAIAILVSCSKDTKPGSDQQSSFVKLFGGSAIDSGACVVECADGGYAITGTMINSANKSQAFLIRTDKYGNELSWSPLFIGSASNTKGSNLQVTSEGDFLVTGSVKTDAGDYDVMVSKISANGNSIWYKTFGGSANDEGFCATEIASGNYIIGGYSESTPSYGGKDEWILNLTKDGDLVWQKNYGGPQDDVCNQILKLDNNLILLGTTYSYQTTVTNPNIYLITIDPANYLTPLGGQSYGGTIKTTGIKGLITNDNHIVVIGNQQITADSSKIYMLCLSGSIYNLVWEKNIQSNNNEWGYDLLSNNNQFIALGATNTSNNLDFLTQTLDTSGNLLSKTPFQSKGDQVISSGIISKDNHLVYTGQNLINGVSKIVLVKTDLPK